MLRVNLGCMRRRQPHDRCVRHAEGSSYVSQAVALRPSADCLASGAHQALAAVPYVDRAPCSLAALRRSFVTNGPNHDTAAHRKKKSSAKDIVGQ